MKSSNDGPLSRVEANEGLVGAGEVVANERMAILEDRWRSSCASDEEIFGADIISFKMHTRDAGRTRPAASNQVNSLRRET
jgi:hypothetical protein